MRPAISLLMHFHASFFSQFVSFSTLNSSSSIRHAMDYMFTLPLVDTSVAPGFWNGDQYGVSYMSKLLTPL